MSVQLILAYIVVLLTAIANLGYKGMEIERLKHPGWPYIVALIAALALYESAEMKELLVASKRALSRLHPLPWLIRLLVIAPLAAMYTDSQVSGYCATQIVEEKFSEALRSELATLESIEEIAFAPNGWRPPASLRVSLSARKRTVTSALGQVGSLKEFTGLARRLDEEPKLPSLELLTGGRPAYMLIVNTAFRFSAQAYYEAWIGHLGTLVLQIAFLLIPYVVAHAALCGARRLNAAQDDGRNSQTDTQNVRQLPIAMPDRTQLKSDRDQQSGRDGRS